MDGNIINWSEKVKDLDENIRREIGIEGECEAKHILIKVQTKAAECIEPAFIVDEDDTFLDLFVLSPRKHRIVSSEIQIFPSERENVSLMIRKPELTIMIRPLKISASMESSASIPELSTMELVR